MDKMPYYEPPLPEETHFSHMLRLAKLNGFDSFLDFANHYLAFQANKVRRVPHDSTQNLAFFFTAAEPNISYSDYILNTTSYSYHAMFMNELKRINIVNKMFMVDNRIKYHSHMDKDSICYCPDCIAEASYFKRLHQVPVVKFCPIHKRPLYEYTGMKHPVLDFPLPGKEISYSLDASAEIQIAEFVQELISSNLDISNLDMQDVITNMINEKGGVETVAKLLHESRFRNVFKNKEYIHYLLKKNIKRAKSHEIELTVIMVFLFKDFVHFWKYYNIYKSRHENIELNSDVLEDLFSTDNYELVSEYRRDLISVKHNDCGHLFISTPYAMAHGWMCPYCSKKMSDEAFQHRMVQYHENGDYTLISAAPTLDDRMTIRHEECGIESHPRYLSFLFTGYICPCRRRLDKAEAEKVIKSSGDFELYKFTKSSDPIEVKCNRCGNIIRYIRFNHHLKIRCNVCEPVRIRVPKMRKRKKTPVDQIRPIIADLVGDRYEVLDIHLRESDGKYELSLRHNECGKEYTAIYRAFITGKGRCVCEGQGVQATDDELKRYIYDISGHRYICIDDKINRTSVTIQDTITGKTHKMKYWRAVQELTRPTHSDLLPCETKVPNALKPRSAPMQFMDYLRETYGSDGVFFPRDFTYDASKAWIASTLNMFLQQGLIKRVSFEIYTFADVEPDWNKIVKLFYVKQNNNRYGCTYGRSFLQELGISVKHPPINLHIMSNRKGRMGSAKPSQKKDTSLRTIGPVSVRLKEAPCSITEDNFKILQVADYLTGHHNQNYPYLTEEEMSVIAKYIHDVPISVINATIAFYPEYIGEKIKTMVLR